MVVALELAREGRSVAIVDKYRRTALHSYALALHPPTLRLLDELGIGERLLELGQPVRWIDVRAGGEPVAEIDLSRVGGPFPFVLVAPQTALEGVLEAALLDLGVSVLWEHQLLSIGSGRDGVEGVLAAVDPDSTAAEPSVTSVRVSCSYLVGADGTGSATARLLGIERTPVGPPLEYELIEFEGEVPSPDRLHLVLDRTTIDVLWPLGPERARFSLQIANGAASDPEDPRERLRSRAPWHPPLERVEWRTTVRFQPSLAGRFGRGRVWLAGDSCHATSPVGVQSMNVGMREGRDLARRLAERIRGRGPSLLRIYNEERQREWKMMLGVKHRIHFGPSTPAWAREQAGRLVSSLPASGQSLNALLRQVGLRLDWLRRTSPR
jgi:2-polyprenyl-6-methoxyphenol hydroxylase-like FAD-dependent oxidoreductase